MLGVEEAARLLGTNEAIRDHFFRWCRMEKWESPDDYPLLQDYIYHWASTDGVEICGGDFGNFASALPLIYSALIENPARLDIPARKGRSKMERRPSLVIDLSGFTAECFSRLWWDNCVFERKTCHCPGPD